MASGGTPATLRGRLASLLVSVATAFVLLGVAILPFFTPQWIQAAQARAGAFVPGYSGADLRDATDEAMRLLFVGPDFTFMIHGANVFDDREVQHMEDVRLVFAEFAAVVLAGAIVLVAASVASRSARERRLRVWRAVARGAGALAALMVAVGVLSVVAFDAAFETFHELLFPAGSFDFDPATERLVQIFPIQFWSDTSLAVGFLALVLGMAVALVGRNRSRRLERAIATADPTEAPVAVPNGSPA